jgi:hypothetical protein
VIHQYKKDRKPAEQIHAIDSVPNMNCIRARN